MRFWEGNENIWLAVLAWHVLHHDRIVFIASQIAWVLCNRLRIPGKHASGRSRLKKLFLPNVANWQVPHING